MDLLWLIVFAVLVAVVWLLVWIWRAKPRTKVPPQQFPQGYSQSDHPAPETAQHSAEEQQKQNTTAAAAWWWAQQHKTPKDSPPDEPKA